MRYVAIAQLFWPVWSWFYAADHSWIGMLVGSAVVLAGWSICWRIEFGNWRFK